MSRRTRRRRRGPPSQTCQWSRVVPGGGETMPVVRAPVTLLSKAGAPSLGRDCDAESRRFRATQTRDSGGWLAVMTMTA
eukprot:636383-Rhodomonas_salina.1